MILEIDTETIRDIAAAVNAARKREPDIAILSSLERKVMEAIQRRSKMLELEEQEAPKRELAAEQAVLDLSPQGVLLRRYQNSATSEMLRMLGALRKEQALQADLRNEPERAEMASQVVVSQGGCDRKSEPKIAAIRTATPVREAALAETCALWSDSEGSEAVPRPPSGPA
jgi:hypothetical protein